MKDKTASRSKLYFLIGLIIGIFVALNFLIKFDNLSKEYSSAKMMFDSKTCDNLFENVKVLCMIMTIPENHCTKAKHLKNTWGRRCNKLLFITSQEDNELDTIVVNISNNTRKALRNKTRDAFYHAHDNYLNDFDWFLKADDDR